MNIIWVSAQSGNDTTGDGSYALPYLTLDKALLVFSSGDQIRLMDGTYIPTDSVIISGVDGSIFSENPNGATIQPEKTRTHQACVAILDTSRFSVTGVNIIQAADTTGNLIGLYVENVENFIAYTCDVSNFSFVSGSAYGIFAAGGGRVERCSVSNLESSGTNLTGIGTKGIQIIDCTADEVSGCADCYTIGMDEDGLIY